MIRSATPWALALGLVLILGCSDDEPTKPDDGIDPPIPAGENVVLRWNEAALQAIRDTRPGPPQTARSLAIVHTAMYDAWACYDAMAVGTRFGGTARRPESQRTEGRKSAAISFAAYRALLDLYPRESTDLAALMSELGYDPTDTSLDPSTAAGVGNLCAKACLDFRHVDGSNQNGELGGAPYSDYGGYQPFNPPIDPLVPTPMDQIPFPDHWQPLTFVNASGTLVTPGFICPHWGNVIPFAMTSPAQFRPAPPAALGSATFRAQCEELIEITANLTDKQKCIAEYWADGPASELPPGHWNLFAQDVSRRDAHTLDEDVKLFFALTNAVFDAGIATWDAKRAYDYCRPITAIRFEFNDETIQSWGGPGLGTIEMLGASWLPYQPASFPTPPFAEYTSGHSAFSAAGAEVLRSFTGSDIFSGSVTIPARSLRIEPGFAPSVDVTLSWATFSEAADEAGMSRRYGGIHFEQGDLRSREMGRRCGVQAWRKARSFFEGTATPVGVSDSSDEVAAR